MTPIKMNNAANYETISVTLTPERFPIAYKNKLEELMDVQAFDTIEEAEAWIKSTPIELELYYENGYGLFGAEAEVIEDGWIRSPYSTAPVLDDDEYEIVKKQSDLTTDEIVNKVIELARQHRLSELKDFVCNTI